MIPTHQGSVLLERSVTSLARQHYAGDLHVVMAVNDSRADSLDRARSLLPVLADAGRREAWARIGGLRRGEHDVDCPMVRPSRSGRPQPAVHAIVFTPRGEPTPTRVRSTWATVRTSVVDRTLGGAQVGEAVDEDYVFLVDGEVEVAAGALDELLAVALRFPAAGLYGGRLIAGSWCGSAAAVRELSRIGPGMMLVDGELWRHLSGLDASLPYGDAEVDLCRRACRAGAQPMVTSSAQYRRGRVDVPSGDVPPVPREALDADASWRGRPRPGGRRTVRRGWPRPGAGSGGR